MLETRSMLMVVGAGLGAAAALRALGRRARRYDFRGKTVLITGSSRGLGLILARIFAAEGARVVIYARNPEELDRARHDLENRGAEVLAVPCDVSRKEEVDRLIASARERFGRVDVLVNNAGVIQVGPLEEQTLDDFEEAMQVHYWSTVYTTMAVMDDMRARRDGRIVNISSIGGRISVPHLLPYTASKFAVTGFSEGLRSELRQYGIFVTTILPGLMRTGSTLNALFKGQNEKEYAWFALGGNLPGASMNAEKAANQIVEACRYGVPDKVLSLPATAAAAFHGLFPGLTQEILAGVNVLLPGPGGIGAERKRGAESETPLTRSRLTALGRKAADTHNQPQ
jgi:NAD(P)-dependent dehydrogenase (short-subunit alcohol dehydrogenase family)